MGYWSELKCWLLRDPAKLIRYVVLFVCCIIVIVQLYECFTKLHNPPISTHAYYNLNDTVEMPAVTICREPPYKEDVLSKIFGTPCLHPKYTACWMHYPYDQVELEEFFQNSTFNVNETFLSKQYGLNRFSSNVEITSNFYFNMGLCHTMRPRIYLKRASKDTGYSMILTHHVNPHNETYNSSLYEKEPGWHMYIHDLRENFTEIQMKPSGRVEYIFAKINEDIEIKLHGKYFASIETKQQSCLRIGDYSESKCCENYIWRDLIEKANCSGPWMPNTAAAPCSDYKSMKNLTTEYGMIYNSDDEPNCDCLESCDTRLFSTYIQNRKSFIQPEPNTQVWIYYTTKLISMIEERPSYDTTQFIADIGGSLGFLLGLSVLGFIGMLEHLTLFLCGGCIKKLQLKHEQRKKMDSDVQSQRSDDTVDIATVKNEKLPPV